MKKVKRKKNIISHDRRRIIFSILLIAFGVFLFLSFFSFMLNWKADQSQLHGFFDTKIKAENALGKAGNFFGRCFVGLGVGITAFLLPVLLILTGLRFGFNFRLISLRKYLNHSVFFLFWMPVFLALLSPGYFTGYGVTGFETTETLKSMIGTMGLVILLAVSFIIYSIISFKKVFELFSHQLFSFSRAKNEAPANNLTEKNETSNIQPNTSPNASEKTNDKEIELSVNTTQAATNIPNTENPQESEPADKENDFSTLEMEVKPIEEEAVVEEEKITYPPNRNTPEGLVSEFGEYDPTLDLSTFQSPAVNLLKTYGNEHITIDPSELETNKNKIVETLNNYKIGIAKIKATVGPTITLYEIIPEAGIRISKIKNLEDDIALSLSALGIRIIAPIPGKGTIGIEVPNQTPRIVSMHSVIVSEKFQKSTKMALPIAFGKTISNETFVVDLAKMPHLLMAGATGQGKSVGINAILASLLYKKHPSELKFILVDPKKVELTLYSKIERHYLAKLPDSEEAIITDNTKVINTLNSLCIEMDNRYELLKDAMVRNILEYNQKFRQRRLNPAEGHRFLPYIVLVVDEFADLIMTAGKEVEMPVARLAQLARAIGIHLIIATQRPSVNVITGIIKANFPVRVAFRVTSKIDSRTIIDAGGADQLVGRGDMLYSTGNDVVRLQCAFVDTAEVEKICEFIGSQKGYADAMLLPEYAGEDAGELEVDLSEKDKLFEEAARLIVIAQQGSTSLIQRKLKLGYNRAGRIIDQLEAAGVVGPFEGSKARQVLIQDENTLEQLLNDLK